MAGTALEGVQRQVASEILRHLTPGMRRNIRVYGWYGSTSVITY